MTLSLQNSCMLFYDHSSHYRFKKARALHTGKITTLIVRCCKVLCTYILNSITFLLCYNCMFLHIFFHTVHPCISYIPHLSNNGQSDILEDMYYNLYIQLKKIRYKKDNPERLPGKELII